MQWLYKNIFNTSIPRTTTLQSKQGTVIGTAAIQLWKPGDLIFFGAGSISHVGIYLGDGAMLHALGRKYGTRMDDVRWYDFWDKGVSLMAVRKIL